MFPPILLTCVVLEAVKYPTELTVEAPIIILFVLVCVSGVFLQATTITIRERIRLMFAILMEFFFTIYKLAVS